VQKIFEILAKAKMKKYLVQDCFFKAHPVGISSFAYTALLTFELAWASPASECLGKS